MTTAAELTPGTRVRVTTKKKAELLLFPKGAEFVRKYGDKTGEVGGHQYEGPGTTYDRGPPHARVILVEWNHDPLVRNAFLAHELEIVPTKEKQHGTET